MGASATSTISQSVLLSGTAGGQGQMYLRVSVTVALRKTASCFYTVCVFDVVSCRPAGQPLAEGAHLLTAHLYARQHSDRRRGDRHPAATGSATATAGSDTDFLF